MLEVGLVEDLIESVAKQDHLIMTERLAYLACDKQREIKDKGSCGDCEAPWKVPDHPLGATEDGSKEDAAEECKIEDPDQGPDIGAWGKPSEKCAAVFVLCVQKVHAKMWRPESV